MVEALEEALRRAIFEELAADEGLLDAEAALNFSTAGLCDKHSMDSRPALMKQCLLLASARQPSHSDEIMLDEVFSKLLALTPEPTGEDPLGDYDALVEQLDALVTPQMRRNYEEANAYYEALLRGPKSTREGENERPKAVNQQDGPAGVKPMAPKGGDFLGRPAPVPSSSASNSSAGNSVKNGYVPMRPLGLSKRTRTEPTKPSEGEEAAAMTMAGSSKESNVDPLLKGIDPKLLETIQNEIIHRVDTVTWDQIAGLEHAKTTIKEIVIWPMLRPDIFTGLRGPPKGLLLFGPPGTGKTMIGKCIASQAQATFFSISASSLTSKWVGEGEKLVRALFACARALQPSVIFIDEIDSLLTQRTDGEFEASRRIKTEFLVQFDGAATSNADRILVIGATNRPQELDEAARRRLVKRLYIPLPDATARRTIVCILLASQQHSLSEAHIDAICLRTEGYSGADVDNLCREAALGPIRGITNILDIAADQVRPISMEDFVAAMTQVRASVSSADLNLYLDWNDKFGSLAVMKP